MSATECILLTPAGRKLVAHFNPQCSEFIHYNDPKLVKVMLAELGRILEEESPIDVAHALVEGNPELQQFY